MKKNSNSNSNEWAFGGKFNFNLLVFWREIQGSFFLHKSHTYTIHRDWFFSLPFVLTDIVHQERVELNTYINCVWISSSLFPLSWRTSSVKLELRTHIHNVWEFILITYTMLYRFLLLPSLYLDGRRPSREKKLNTYPMCENSFFSLSS